MPVACIVRNSCCPTIITAFVQCCGTIGESQVYAIRCRNAFDTEHHALKDVKVVTVLNVAVSMHLILGCGARIGAYNLSCLLAVMLHTSNSRPYLRFVANFRFSQCLTCRIHSTNWNIRYVRQQKWPVVDWAFISVCTECVCQKNLFVALLQAFRRYAVLNTNTRMHTNISSTITCRIYFRPLWGNFKQIIVSETSFYAN